MRNQNESQLVCDVMSELGKHGAIFRTNAGQYYTKTGQRVSGLPKGFSDVLFVGNDGIACFVECKIQGNTASPEQEQFIKKMQALGARAGVVYTVEQAAELCGLQRKEITP